MIQVTPFWERILQRTNAGSSRIMLGVPGDQSFSVHKNGTDQTGIAADTDTLITFSTELFDTNNDFASNRLTPTVAGKYLLTGSWRIGNAGPAIDDGDPAKVMIFKNGSELHGVTVRGSGPGVRSHVIAAVVDANGSTDYFELYMRHSVAAGQDVEGDAARTWFTGMRIGS